MFTPHRCVRVAKGKEDLPLTRVVDQSSSLRVVFSRRLSRGAHWSVAVALGLGFSFFTASTALGADPGPARLVRAPGTKKVQGLSWGTSVLEVNEEPTGKGSATRSTVTLRGKFTKEDWNLIWNSRRLKPSENGLFQIKVPLSGKLTRVELVAVSPLGQVEKESLGISFPTYVEYRKALIASRTRRNFVTPGLGITSLTYTQPSRLAQSCSMTALTAKAGYTYLAFPPNWDLGISGYVTVAPLSSSCLVGGTQATMRFAGLNFRAGYTVPSVRDPWRLSLMFGWYYTTMLTSVTDSANAFGFQNMAGPQLFPVIRRSFKNGNSIVGYFKFSPVSNNFSFLNLDSREIALGGAYVVPLKNGHPVSVTLDYADLKLKLPNTAGVMEDITSKSISLGLGYGF